MENEIAKPEPKWTIHSALAGQAQEIDKALANAIPRDQFLRICATVWQTGGAKMHKADFRSFIGAVVEAAQLGLKPDNVLGECYFIPRKGVVCFQMGYRGAMKLARRGGEVTDIQPEIIYANDEYRPMYGTSRGIHHVPWWAVGAKEPGEIVAAYCTAQLRSGVTSYRVVERSEIDEICKKSGNPFNDSPSNVWRDHFAAMAMKTAVLRLCKFLPIPDDAKRAIIREEYRDAGVPEHSITVEAIDDEAAMIADLRQDPKEIERVAIEKETTTQARQQAALVAATRKRLWNSEAGERFFKAAGAKRDTPNVNKFIKFATDSDATGDIEVLRTAQDFLVQWVTEPNAEEAEETVSKFAKIVSGEYQGDENAEDAFEASLEAQG